MKQREKRMVEAFRERYTRSSLGAADRTEGFFLVDSDGFPTVKVESASVF